MCLPLRRFGGSELDQAMLASGLPQFLDALKAVPALVRNPCCRMVEMVLHSEIAKRLEREVEKREAELNVRVFTATGTVVQFVEAIDGFKVRFCRREVAPEHS